MLLTKSLFYLLVLASYYFLGKKLNLITTIESNSKLKHKAVYGAGVLFPIILIVEGLQLEISIYFIISIFLLALLSFFDDVKPINAVFKLIFHLILGFVAVVFVLKFNSKDCFLVIFFAGFFITFYTNANNFMDGINGMMIINNLLIFSTLLIINSFKIEFTNNDLLIYLVLGTLIFFVFNFRKRAIIISGDVGSIILGFTIIIFVFTLYFKTKNIFVFGLTITFFVETVLTIILRLCSHKNILESHKEHLYEVLVLNNKIPVITVSSTYGLVQLLLSSIVLSSFYYELNNKIFYAILISYILIYLFLRYKFLKNAKAD